MNDTQLLTSDFDFGTAVAALKAGHQVTRENWNGPGQRLALQTPDAHSKMTQPYIYITTVQGDLIPWLASQSDVLANDWRIAPALVEPYGSNA